jgi:hypothetical protein
MRGRHRDAQPSRCNGRAGTAIIYFTFVLGARLNADLPTSPVQMFNSNEALFDSATALMSALEKDENTTVAEKLRAGMRAVKWAN